MANLAGAVSVHPPRAQYRDGRWAYFASPALLVALVVFDGARHRTCPPAQGTGLQGETAPEKPAARLRLASFNIHGCRDVCGRFDFERTARSLESFDVIGLNEVHGDWQWGPPDQAEQLGRRLNMTWLFAPTTHRWWREDFGNGLLSRFPVGRWQRVPLVGTRTKGHRNYLQSEIAVGAMTLHVLVTHLDSVQDSAIQLKHISQRFLELPEPAILMGDMNTKANDPQLARLLSTPGIVDLVRAGTSTPSPDRIDWILGRGLRAIDGGLIETGASDHPLVWAEVELLGKSKD